MLATGVLNTAPAASQASADTLSGVIRSEEGLPIDGANVFLLETLEGAVTDSAGHFRFRTRHRGSAMLIVRRIGYEERRAEVSLPLSEPLEIELEPQAVALESVTVRAGSYAAGNEPDASLSALEVVTTPGTAADVFRALQTFPGLVPVDDGAGLFVRGGDVSETKVLVDGAVVLSPYRWESPTGGTFGAFDPFLLDGIRFSSGGFGARYGDALSGIVALETLGRPERSEAGVTASLAAVSGNVALALPAGIGMRGTATRTSTDLLFRLERSRRRVPEGPRGHGPERERGLELSFHRQDQAVRHQSMGQPVRIDLEEPSYAGAFSNDGRGHLLVLSGRDIFGSFAPVYSLSLSQRRLHQEFGAFRLADRERSLQASARVTWAPSNAWSVASGAEIEQRDSRLEGSAPAAADLAPNAPAVVFASEIRGIRSAVFVETEWRPARNACC